MNYAAMLADGRGGTSRTDDLAEAKRQYGRAERLAAVVQQGMLSQGGGGRSDASVATHMQASARAGRARVDDLLAAAADPTGAAGAAGAEGAAGAAAPVAGDSGGGPRSCSIM